jgi:hypothetical protein
VEVDLRRPRRQPLQHQRRHLHPEALREVSRAHGLASSMYVLGRGRLLTSLHLGVNFLTQK